MGAGCRRVGARVCAGVLALGDAWCRVARGPPAAAVATPVAAFTFDGVRILHEEATEEVPPSYRGEVHDFAVDPAAGSFQLETAGVVLWFTAERATLVMRRDSAEFADGAARVTTLLG